MAYQCKDCKHWNGNEYATYLCKISHNWHVAVDSCCCYYKQKSRIVEMGHSIIDALTPAPIKSPLPSDLRHAE